VEVNVETAALSYFQRYDFKIRCKPSIFHFTAKRESINTNLLSFGFLFIVLIFFSYSREEHPNPSSERYRMLLIGNSFFKPYTNHLDAVAADA
jgi:hypothetical protein